ncbi:D-alanyl-D-alanine carboxypeptidase family protein [Candidatus Saccharibacteria bacterium]|nr:D-alanyl-D-alanine carboxypeptidase family protein [Candidatus Saccharibacteria bacterium]
MALRRKDLFVIIAFVFVVVASNTFAFLALAAAFIATEEEPAPMPESSPTLEQLPSLSDNTTPSSTPITNSYRTATTSGNCTLGLGPLMLINYNFRVNNDFIATRRSELVNVAERYGVIEGNPYNGAPLLDAEAAVHLNDMIKAYQAAYPGHNLETRSCFRSRGTSCGRLCMPTGTSDHHTGYTCDLIDPAYGTELDTSHLSHHLEWQWLKDNSYKYGFIDRFPAAWAGSSMSEPLNVDANGSTGLYETWHYRYVGIPAATAIATGQYNNGAYDSLEHYLLKTGKVTGLNPPSCD